MDIKEIEHLAQLSKLEFSPEEMESFSKEFEHLVEFADIVKNADLQGEQNIQKIDLGKLRDDEIGKSTPTEILLKDSPLVKQDCIVVPRIME